MPYAIYHNGQLDYDSINETLIGARRMSRLPEANDIIPSEIIIRRGHTKAGDHGFGFKTPEGKVIVNSIKKTQPQARLAGGEGRLYLLSVHRV